MKISNMCGYMQWRYTMGGFIQWRDVRSVARYARCGGDSCCRRLEEDVSNWGRVVG